MVELALTLPLLALLLLGTVDLGRAFFYYQRLTNAVREGALVGAVDPTSTARIRLRIEREGQLDLTNIQIRCYEGLSTTTLRGTGDCSVGTTPATTDVQHGDTLQVSAEYRFRPLTRQLVGMFGSTITLRKTARMMVP